MAHAAFPNGEGEAAAYTRLPPLAIFEKIKKGHDFLVFLGGDVVRWQCGEAGGKEAEASGLLF